MAEFRIIFASIPMKSYFFALRARARCLWLRLQVFPYFIRTIPWETEIKPMFSISRMINRALRG
jgi:hypothetical protein